MGRKKLDDPKRTLSLTVTESERKYAEALASKSGMTVSELGHALLAHSKECLDLPSGLAMSAERHISSLKADMEAYRGLIAMLNARIRADEAEIASLTDAAGIAQAIADTDMAAMQEVARKKAEAEARRQAKQQDDAQRDQEAKEKADEELNAFVKRVSKFYSILPNRGLDRFIDDVTADIRYAVANGLRPSEEQWAAMQAHVDKVSPKVRFNLKKIWIESGGKL